MNSIVQDLRYALRGLTRSPGFTTVAVLTLALGIGGTAAMFSVTYGVLLRPLPYLDPQRLVGLWEVHPGANAPLKNDLLSHPTYHAWAESSATLDAIGAYTVKDHNVSEPGAPIQRLRGVAITPSMFKVLRVVPVEGRFFEPSDAERGATPIVVITERLWRQRFAGDSSPIGRTLTIDNIDHGIVGITSVSFPDTDIQLYTPLAVTSAERSDRTIGILTAVGRLKPGATVAQAEAEGTSRASAVQRPFANLVFGEGGPVQVRVRPLVDQQTRAVRPALFVLSLGVGLLLLIACANFANLLLSRGASRVREFAVRASLGAGRDRLLRQLVTESLVISLIGAVFGILAGWLVIQVLVGFAPVSFPRIEEVRVDVGFVAVAALTAILAGLMAGLWPAIQTVRDLHAGVQIAGLRGGTLPRGHLQPALVIIEAALAVVLLVGATLLGRSFVALLAVDAGYQPTNVLTAQVGVVSGVDRPKRMAQLAIGLAERLQAAPGVAAVGLGSMAPFGTVLDSVGFALPGVVTQDGQPVVARALRAVITPGYAEALGMRLREGRLFVASDAASSDIAMIVSETFARTYFRDGRGSTGRRFRGMFPKILGRNDAVVTVVGVVDDVLPDRLDALPQPQIYVPVGVGFGFGGAMIVVKSEGDPTQVAPLVRTAVQELEPGAVLDRVGLLTAKRSESASEPRFATFILGAFAVLALALSMTGLYGILSYSVAQRTRELGVRGALGATRADLYIMVLREGLAMTAIGIVMGMGAAALATRGMTILLFGVKPLDMTSFALASVLLIVVACGACAIPARRAARVDPLVALRYE